MVCKKLLANLIRKKPSEAWVPEIPLKRCLTAIDLTSLGVGTTVGTGLYVAIGELARSVAGPSVVLSLLLASSAAFLCALSFAEYGSRFPDAGSSYLYTYATLGEISAFIVGWNVALEFLITGASLARTCRRFIDSASNGQVFLFLSKHFSKYWIIPGEEPFPDLLAAALVLAVMAILCLGARTSTNFHNLVTIINLGFILFIIVFGFFFVDLNHWKNNFMPYGVSGVLEGAAGAFFAFSGFDIVAEAAEEAVDPEKNLPKSFFITIILSTLAYISVASVLTLMVPYYELDKYAPLAEAFGRKTFSGAMYIIVSGGICATVSALLCAVYSTSRIVYSMSVDGLLFRWFSKVHSTTQVPYRATLVSGIITALIALMFDVNQMVELLSIGTLVAYTKVTISVLVSRFQSGVQSVPENYEGNTGITQWLHNIFSKAKRTQKDQSSGTAYQQITDEEDSCSRPPTPRAEVTEATTFRAEVAVFFLVISLAALAVILSYSFQHVFLKGEWWAIFLLTLFSGAVIVQLFVIQLQPRNSATFPFMVPGVPYISALTIFINAVLMANLQWGTYVRFGVWMMLGFIIYLFYGYRHSTEALKPVVKEIYDVTLETPEVEQKMTKPQPP
ncbi:probable cationic amino acid transporter isoform X1 [Stylophora pistillata]|nr:probable cationic amino acid transporter isoform X1 [Stylophora pistillata]